MSNSKQDKLVNNPNQKVNIYTLADPRSPEIIRYVGKTILSIEERLRCHINKIKYRKCHNSNWVRSLIKVNLHPLVSLLEQVDESEWVEKEKYYIAHYKNMGYPLVNHTEGGEGASGYRHTEEFKASRRKPEHLLYRNRIRKFPTKEESYKARSERMKGINNFHTTKETIAKAAQASSLVNSKAVLEWKEGLVINTYKSVSSCSKITGLIDSNIARVCRGVSKHTGGRYFTYDIVKPSK